MQWWQWLLILTASFLLAAFILVSAGIAFLKAKLKQWSSGIGDAFKSLATNPIAETLTLTRCDKAEIDKRPGMREAINEVKSLGFEIDGPFFADQNRTVLCMIGASPKDSVANMLIAAPNRVVVVDFVTSYEDGAMLTHTTLEDQGMDRAMLHRAERHPTLSASELLAAHLQDRPAKPMKSVALSNVPELAKQATEEEWFWRATRGGLTDSELERQIARQPKPEGGDDIVSKINPGDFLRTLVRSRAQAFLEEQFRKKLLAEGGLSAARWEEIEDRLVFVLDSTDPEVLASRLYAAKSRGEPETGDENDDGSFERFTATLKTGQRREMFRTLNDQLPIAKQLEFFSTMRIERKLATAIADVYLAAEDEEQSDD